MSLNTLLEAAKFLEMQELKEQQQQQRIIETTIVPTPLTTIKTTQIPAKQAVLLTTTDLVQTTTLTTSSTTTTTLTNGSSNSSNNSIINQNGLKTKEQYGNVIVTASAGLSNLTTTTTGIQIQQQQQQQQRQQRFLNNSFDILNQINVDGSVKNSEMTNTVINTAITTATTPVITTTTTTTQTKRKQPPMIFRAGTREVHNKLEKHRRAHLKECFDILKKQLPQQQDEKKTSNLSILHSALRCIQTLKRKERELEHEMERLARDKISAQQRLAILKKDIQQHYDNVDFTKILPEILPTITTTLATTDEINLKNDNINNNNNNNISNNNSNQNDRIPIPLLPNKTQISVATSQVGAAIKEITQQQQQSVQQTTALSVLPVTYPVSQGLVLQKLAIVPKNLTDLTPLVSTHFITTTTTTQQQLNGKVVPLVNAQYVVKPVVVVSRPS